MKVIEKKETSRADRGIVTFEMDLKNQCDEVVTIGKRTMMMARQQS